MAGAWGLRHRRLRSRKGAGVQRVLTLWRGVWGRGVPSRPGRCPRVPAASIVLGAALPVEPGGSPWALGSKEHGLKLGAMVGGVGIDETGTKTKGVTGGLQGVAAGGHVVHKVGLA
jgi:hypothetical protein